MTIRSELRRRWWLVLVVLAVLLLLFGSRLATLYTDILWFNSIGFVDVFWNLLRTQAGLGIVAGLVMFALVAANLLLAQRLAPAYRIPSPAEEVIERYRQVLAPYIRLLLIGVALVTGILGGLAVVGEWRDFLLWANGGEFGTPDPHFGRDLGFFVFQLPFLTTVNGWLFSALLVTILLTAVGHYLFGGIRPQQPGQKISAAANVHLSILLAGLVAVRAWGFWLDRYLLSYSDRGQVTGLSYTDVNAQLRAFELLTVIAVVCVLLFLVNIRVRGWVLPSAGVGILVVAAVLLGGLYPAVIQRLQVDPQELPRERDFIARNLEMTRWAYGIDETRVSYERFPATTDLTTEEVNANATTLEAIRLWDPATLQNTYQQLQVLRPYYQFRDVDVDRYVLDDQLQQVMVAAREISEADLPSTTWQNQRLVFTHGFGMVSSAVSTAGADGQPVFFVRDIPPAGAEEFTLDQPRIYFGESPPRYSIVDTDSPELDFETEVGQEFTTYDGADGVGVGSPLRRLAFALRYAEPNILLSGLITPESRILYHRDIDTRIRSVAPFLELDHDPYPVAVDGRIQWIQDAYTISDMVPYSERVDLAALTSFQERRTVIVPQADGSLALQDRIISDVALRGQANYLRNSVKAVVDAYDGTVTLYVTDPDDPLIQAWDRAFPGVLTPLEEAPDELREHFRYPEDLFRVQMELLRTYHIQDPDPFYTKSDAWDVPEDLSFRNNQAGEAGVQARTFPPTYQVLRLPGEEVEDFALIQPFAPAEREVLSAYVAARTDRDNDLDLRVLQMPPQRTVFGPEQVFARINQDDAVSEQITLWNQSGSRVIYGNLIVVPIEDSLLYALPLFLRSQQSEIPELRRVVLVFGDQVVMRDRLTGALEAVFGELPDVAEEEAPDVSDDVRPDDVPPPDQPVVPDEATDLIAAALQAFAEADAALREGDLGGYQERLAEAQALLEEISGLLGLEAPVGAPATGTAASRQ